MPIQERECLTFQARKVHEKKRCERNKNNQCNFSINLFQSLRLEEEILYPRKSISYAPISLCLFSMSIHASASPMMTPQHLQMKPRLTGTYQGVIHNHRTHCLLYPTLDIDSCHIHDPLDSNPFAIFLQRSTTSSFA